MAEPEEVAVLPPTGEVAPGAAEAARDVPAALESGAAEAGSSGAPDVWALRVTPFASAETLDVTVRTGAGADDPPTDGVVTDGTVPTGVGTRGVVTDGTLTVGGATGTVGVVTRGVVTLGVVTDGVVPTGVLTEGTVTEGTVAEGTVTDGRVS